MHFPSLFQRQRLCGRGSVWREVAGGAWSWTWGWKKPRCPDLPAGPEGSICTLHGERGGCRALLQRCGVFPSHSTDSLGVPRCPGMSSMRSQVLRSTVLTFCCVGDFCSLSSESSNRLGKNREQNSAPAPNWRVLNGLSLACLSQTEIPAQDYLCKDSTEDIFMFYGSQMGLML